MRPSNMWIGAEDRAHQDEEEAEANRQTASLGGLALALALVVIGLFLVRTLHEKAQIEDCLLSGRQDCDVLVTAEP